MSSSSRNKSVKVHKSKLYSMHAAPFSSFNSPLPFTSSPPLLISLMCTAQDLEDLSEHLPNTFKTPLSDHLKKRFEYEFHSASYHLMVEVLTALRTVLGHLVKALEPVDSSRDDLQSETAVGFMSKLYNHLSQHGDVLNEIGIQSASSAHLRCLADLPLKSTFSCLKLFFYWVDEGFYDFSAIPFQFKVHLGREEEEAIEKLCVTIVFEDLQQLIDLLKQSEQDVTNQVNEAINVSVS